MQADWRPGSQTAAFKVCKYIQSCGSSSIKSCSPPEPGNLDVSPGGTWKISGLQKCVSAHFWKTRVSYSQADTTQRWHPFACFPHGQQEAPRCVPDLKPTPRAEAPSTCTSFIERLGVFPSAKNCLFDCYSPMDPGMQAPLAFQGCVLLAAANTPAPGGCRSSHWEILGPWSAAEGGRKDGTGWLQQGAEKHQDGPAGRKKQNDDEKKKKARQRK